MTDLVVPVALAGERLDRLVALVGDVARARAAELVDAGLVEVNGVAVMHRSHRVEAGDAVRFPDDEPASEVVTADGSVAVPVVHEDRDVIVIDKPAGMVVHPGAGHRTGTLVQGLVARYPELVLVGEPQRPGIVHRLDAGTSGLLVVARTPAAYESLVRQLGARTVERRYRALVWAHVDAPAGVIDAPVGRSDRDPTRMAVTARGREARTRYEVETRFDHPAEVTLLRCQLETGRTHQIRVHLASIGHPVVGDDRYGGQRSSLPLDRPFLHAATLGFEHPGTGAWVSFESPLPPDLAATLAACS